LAEKVLANFDRLAITRLPHLPYSRYFASCDFWLFETLKRGLERCPFGDPIEVMMGVSTILTKILLDEFV
jgi:hypothetical protein